MYTRPRGGTTVNRGALRGRGPRRAGKQGGVGAVRGNATPEGTTLAGALERRAVPYAAEGADDVAPHPLQAPFGRGVPRADHRSSCLLGRSYFGPLRLRRLRNAKLVAERRGRAFQKDRARAVRFVAHVEGLQEPPHGRGQVAAAVVGFEEGLHALRQGEALGGGRFLPVPAWRHPSLGLRTDRGGHRSAAWICDARAGRGRYHAHSSRGRPLSRPVHPGWPTGPAG